jgi:hypothetical protein
MNRKKLILTLIIAISSIFIECVAQNKKTLLQSQLIFTAKESINLPNQYENPSDSFVNDIMSRTPYLKKYLDREVTYYSYVLKDSTFYTDLNGDDKIDMFLYIDGYWNGDGIEIYINKGDYFEKVYSCPLFRLTNIFKPATMPLTYLSTVSYRYSVWPYLSAYNELTILKSQILKNTTYFFQGTKFPEKVTMNKSVKILNDKYNLRLTPKIYNKQVSNGLSKRQIGNIILQLAKGDKGVAYAEKKDKTGRIWYFVKMENNINKSLDEYYYIDSENERSRKNKGENLTIDKPIFGWISSNYIEVIKQ